MKLLMNLNYKLFALYKSVVYNYFLFLWQNSTQRSVRTTLCALLVCSSVLLFQCGDDDDKTPPNVEITITADKTEVTLPSEEGNHDIKITASETSWDVSESIAWLEATKVNNTTLRVSYQENTGAERSGKVTATIEEESLEITVTQRADAEPSFGTSTIDNQTYIENSAISDETLPAATGGTGTLTYSLTPALPSGLDFDEDTRILSGTPAAGSAAAAATYTYTATDENDDEVTLQFTITVEEDLMPAFDAGEMIANQIYTEGLASNTLTLPEVTSGSGNGTLEYSLTPALPNGLDFDEDTRILSGTPTDAAAVTTYTYTATDEDNDEVTLQFTITVRAASTVTAMLNTATLSVTASSTTSSTIMLTMNVAWEATKTASWITSISPASGSGSATAQAIQIDYTANTGAVRSATVTFTETTAGASPPHTLELTVMQLSSVFPEGLIPVGTLEQLNAIRYDLDTDGKVDDAANAADYAEAFPDVVYETTNTTKYTGYALSKSLDFDVDASYSDHATNKAGWTSSTGWEPIGYWTSDSDNATFRGTFDGKGHTISNLFIDRDSDDNIRIGLFGHVNGAMIRSLGLVDPDITGQNGGAAHITVIGGIVGWLSFVPGRGSQILGCYVSGGTITGGTQDYVGGIAGHQVGSWIGGCYVSDVDITGGAGSVVGGITGNHPDGGGTIACYVSGGTTITGGANSYVGGMTGWLGTTGNDQDPTLMACYIFDIAITVGAGNSSHKGSLVGFQHKKGQIIACYAGGRDYEKLVGSSDENLTVMDSYYEDSNASSADDMSQTAQAKTRSALQTPTAYGSAATDIYADWNVDIDNTDDDDNIITGKDDPWDFDNGSSYPVLNVDFNNNSSTADDITAQRSALGS